MRRRGEVRPARDGLGRRARVRRRGRVGPAGRGGVGRLRSAGPGREPPAGRSRRGRRGRLGRARRGRGKRLGAHRSGRARLRIGTSRRRPRRGGRRPVGGGWRPDLEAGARSRGGRLRRCRRGGRRGGDGSRCRRHLGSDQDLRDNPGGVLSQLASAGRSPRHGRLGSRPGDAGAIERPTAAAACSRLTGSHGSAPGTNHSGPRYRFGLPVRCRSQPGPLRVASGPRPRARRACAPWPPTRCRRSARRSACCARCRPAWSRSPRGRPRDR